MSIAASKRTNSTQAIHPGSTPAESPSSSSFLSSPTHPLSNPTLANIEKRWEDMPHQEQADLWMALRDRMQGSWHELTYPEKKAAYWVAFGPHGPRAPLPPVWNAEIARMVFTAIGVAATIFGLIRYFARPAPHTMTREWQEASNEYLKAQNADPITGISSLGYKGKGMIQSPPGGN